MATRKPGGSKRGHRRPGNGQRADPERMQDDGQDGTERGGSQDAPGDELPEDEPEVERDDDSEERGEPGPSEDQWEGADQDEPDGGAEAAEQADSRPRDPSGRPLNPKTPPHLVPYLYPPGVSGNPGGRPRQKHIIDLVVKEQRALLHRRWQKDCERAVKMGEEPPPPPAEDEDDLLVARSLLEMIIIDRSPAALMEYLNRKYGPVKDASSGDVGERLAELAKAMAPKPGAVTEGADDPELELKVREAHRFDEDPADAEYAVVSSTPGLPPAPPRRQRDDVDGSNIVADGPVLQAPIEPAEDDLDDEEGFD